MRRIATVGDMIVAKVCLGGRGRNWASGPLREICQLNLKEDKPALLLRCDLNCDGVTNANEWALALESAKREAEDAISATETRPDANVVGPPMSGKIFLISNLPRSELARHHRFFLAHLLVLGRPAGWPGWTLLKAIP